MKIKLGTGIKKGFTLAEVLVTLAIIGVLAALTIPSLIQSVQNSQYESTLKKNYSAIAQAYLSIQGEGTDIIAAFPGTDTGATALNIIAPKLNILKNCGKNMGCWYDDTPVLYLKGAIQQSTIDTAWKNDYGKAMLSNGSLIAIWDFQTNCTTNKGTGVLSNSVCGEIFIDINGAKAPNKWGRDFFGFWITKTGIYSFGSNGDSYINDCYSTSMGLSCATKVLTQGMNY